MISGTEMILLVAVIAIIFIGIVSGLNPPSKTANLAPSSTAESLQVSRPM